MIAKNVAATKSSIVKEPSQNTNAPTTPTRGLTRGKLVYLLTPSCLVRSVINALKCYPRCINTCVYTTT